MGFKMFKFILFFLLAPLGTLHADTMEDMLFELADQPQIIDYTSQIDTISKKQGVLLNWKVSNALRVDVEDGFFNRTYPNLAHEGYIEVWPEETSQFTLIAYGANGSRISRSLTIKVNKLRPEIVYFQASEEAIDSVRPVRLSWKVKNASIVDIHDGFRNVTYPNLGRENSIEVWPEKSSFYTLWMTGEFGNRSSERILIKFEDVTPKILSFSTSTYQGLPGDRIDLKWLTQNAEHVSLELDHGNRIDYHDKLAASGSFSFILEAPTRCKLTVTNKYSQTISHELEVKMANPPAKLKYFYSSHSNTHQGGQIQLSWDVEYTKSIRIKKNGVPVQGIFSAKGHLVDTPLQTTNYELEYQGFDNIVHRTMTSVKVH